MDQIDFMLTWVAFDAEGKAHTLSDLYENALGDEDKSLSESDLQSFYEYMTELRIKGIESVRGTLCVVVEESAEDIEEYLDECVE